MNIRLITIYKGANLKEQITLVLFIPLALALAASSGKMDFNNVAAQ
jgi:hypothetical protein